MIPEHIIETAMDAYNAEAGTDLRSNAGMQAAIESAAADIWDEGFEVGESNGYAIGRDIETSEDTTNPYRASETK